MVCYPCTVGGSEYKAYTNKPYDDPLQGKKNIMMYNDYENAYLKSGKELERFIPVSTTPPSAYFGSMDFGEFKKTQFSSGGKLLFMTYQRKCTNKQHMGQERFYVAEIPFRGVTYKNDTVIFNTKATALYWSGINIKVKSDDKQILSVKSSPTILKDMVMPFGALFVKPNLKM